MSGKPTPGPWQVEIIGSPRVIAEGAKGGTFPICDIRGWGYLTGKGHGALGLPHDEAVAIQNANTHLIAAAPDMLDFVKWVADRGEPNNQMEIFQRARQLVAKAKGRAP